jgi:hypothetical protein
MLEIIPFARVIDSFLDEGDALSHAALADKKVGEEK